MATGNQGQGQGQRRGEGQGQNRNNGGAGQGQGHSQGQGQNPAQAQAHGPAQTVADVGQRLREGYDTTREEVAHRYRQAEGAFARNPGSSVFVAFGVGVGLGLALTSMMGRREETWAEKYLPDSLRDLPETFRKNVPQNVRDVHWSDAYGQLCEAVNNLPSAIAKAVRS